MADTCDVLVIGGGPVGLATALECAKAGKTVVVLERFTLFNSSGSSGDFVRMFRVMYTEPYLADLALAARDKWQLLEKNTGAKLVQWTGLLNFGDPEYGQNGPEGTLKGPVENMERLKLPYKELSAQDIQKDYAFVNLPGNYIGIQSEHDCGIINVPNLLRTLYKSGCKYDIKYREFAEATTLHDNGCEGVQVTYQQLPGPQEKKVLASKVVVACGAYTNKILQPLGFELALDVWEMVYAYYSMPASKPGAKAMFPSMWFHFADNDHGKSNLFYGFPPVPWGPPDMARIAVDTATRVVGDPAERQPGPSEDDLRATQEFIRRHCPRVIPDPNLAGSCLQTNVVDNNFVLDFLPGDYGKKVVVFCAGWAMKFVPLLGEILKDLALEGTTTHNISHFSITRAGVLVKDIPDQTLSALGTQHGSSQLRVYRGVGGH